MSSYNEKHIKVFSGLSGIRRKPSMYIGPVDSHGLFMLVKEAADNTVDEFNAGRNKWCQILVSEDGTVYVVDGGSGIPVKPITDPETKVKASALKFIVSSHHAGGKFDDAAYTHSVGTHGIGIKAVNALSDYFQVWTRRDNQWWTTEYAKGKEVQEVQTTARPPKLPHGFKSPAQGTIIAFRPDATIFERGAKLNPRLVAEWCELTAYLNGGFRVTFADRTGKAKDWHHPKGAVEYLDHVITKLKVEAMGKPLIIQQNNIDVALAFTSYDGGDHVEAFTNSSRNADGGVHVDTLWKVLAKTIKPYAGRNTFSAADVRDGLVGVINYKISSPQFSSQTKEKLVDVRVKEQCDTTLTEAFTAFWSKNKTLAKDLCARAASLRTAKDELMANKKVIMQLKGNKLSKKGLLPGKFAEARRCTPDARELFLVEGESAGGTAKKARNIKYQEVLPMKGKIMNAYKAKGDKIFTSDEVMNVLKVIGYNPAVDNPINHLRIGKLILLSDGDVDGLHINTLEIALIAKYLPGMFEKEMVYAVRGPKYLLKHKGMNYFGNTIDDIQRQVPKGVKVDQAQYLKGWGEINAEALREIAFDPAHRQLIKLMPPSKKDMKEFVQLMSDDVAYRRELLGI